MDSPPPRGVGPPAVSRTNFEDYELDSDDDLDEDYVLGNLDASDYDDDSEVDDEDDDDEDENDRSRQRVEREEMEDTDSDVSLEDEDFSALIDEVMMADEDSRGISNFNEATAGTSSTPQRRGTTRSGTAAGRDLSSIDAYGMSRMLLGTPTRGRGGRTRRGAVPPSLFDETSRGSAGGAGWIPSALNSPATRAAGAAMDMLLYDIDDEDLAAADAIARRTRAHVSLADRALDELEMPTDEALEEAEFEFLDEENEYANFLSALNILEQPNALAELEAGVGGGVDADADDDDDDNDDDYAEEDPKAAELELRVREERRAAARAGAASVPQSVLRRSERLGDGETVEEHPAQARIRVRKLWQTAHEAFTPGQFTRLHQQIYQHSQLLLQSYAVVATREDSVALTRTLFVLISNLQTAGAMTFHRKQLARHEPHDASIFKPTPTVASWYHAPREKVYTFLQCEPLKASVDFVTDINALGFIDGPELWRKPTLLHEFTKRKVGGAGAQQLKEWPNSKSHVRMDSLFRDAERSIEDVLNEYSNAKQAKVAETKDDRWKPIPWQVFDVAKRYIGRILPDPSILIGAGPYPTHKSPKFLGTDDSLLAYGLRIHGNDYETIQRTLLVAHTIDDIRCRVRNCLNDKKRHEVNAVKEAYEYGMRPLDENEIAVIQRTFSEHRADIDIETYLPKVWKDVCERLSHRQPKSTYRVWRRQIRIGEHMSMHDALLLPRLSMRRKRYVRRGRPVGRPRKRPLAESNAQGTHTERQVDADGVVREHVDDSDSEDRAAYERDELSDSDSDDERRPRTARQTQRPTGTNTTAANTTAGKRLPALASWTDAQDHALVSAAAFAEPFESLLAPGAPCAGRSLDALIIRYNQLKAARGRVIGNHSVGFP